MSTMQGRALVVCHRTFFDDVVVVLYVLSKSSFKDPGGCLPVVLCTNVNALKSAAEISFDIRFPLHTIP